MRYRPIFLSSFLLSLHQVVLLRRLRLRLPREHAGSASVSRLNRDKLHIVTVLQHQSRDIMTSEMARMYIDLRAWEQYGQGLKRGPCNTNLTQMISYRISSRV
ncbi:hypothetical protein BJY01DRAFT_206041 [Aspergillus pseudoustus]|uniref:Secreted protein n=1 Tax=Aspergillus pseudoustus TaxID=1810923 RepID=A0ABR4KQ14_9EURO